MVSLQTERAYPELRTGVNLTIDMVSVCFAGKEPRKREVLPVRIKYGPTRILAGYRLVLDRCLLFLLQRSVENPDGYNEPARLQATTRENIPTEDTIIVSLYHRSSEMRR